MAGDVGALGNLAAERAAVYQVRPRAVEAPGNTQATAVERDPGPQEGVTLSDKAQTELGGTRERGEAASPPPVEKSEDRGGDKTAEVRGKAADAAEELRAELAKPKDEQDPEKVQKLIADIQGELNGDAQPGEAGGEPKAEGGEARPDGEKKPHTPLSGEVFGRPVSPNDAHDMFWRWQQESGRPAPRNTAEAREAYKDLAAFAEKHGFKLDVVEHERLDKIVITTPDGKQVKADVVANMGGEFGSQRWWFGDITKEGGGAAPTGSGGPVGDVPLEGYDNAKLHDLNHRTPKYVFGRVASRHSLAGVHSKEDAGALLASMVEELRAQGLEIVDVKGDKIQVRTELGYEWVDVVRGAGSGNPGWWWGSEGRGTPYPT